MKQSILSFLRGSLFKALSPIEKWMLAGMLISFVIVDAFRRPFVFMFMPIAKIMWMNFSWVFPCFIAAYLVRLCKGSSAMTRRLSVLYLLAMTLVYFYSSTLGSVGKGVFAGSMGAIGDAFLVVNAGLLLISAVLTWAEWQRDASHARTTLLREASRGIISIRLLGTLLLCFSVYSNLKAMIPIMNGASFDELCYRLDCTLFLGHDPFELINRLDAPWFVRLMQGSYLFCFMFMLFCMAATLLFGTIREFERAMASFIIGYGIGMAGYVAMPAVGPAFASATAELFHASDGFGVRGVLGDYYRMAVERPTQANLVPFVGLASMPSLHVAHSAAALYYLWLCERRIASLLAIPFMLLLVSTVYLGMHYVIDLPAGIAVAWASVVLANKMYPIPKEAEELEPEEEGLAPGEACDVEKLIA